MVAIKTEGVPFLEAIPDVAAYARRMRQQMKKDAPLLNPQVAEPRVYSLILTGDDGAAARTLSTLQDWRASQPHGDQWAHDLWRRVTRINELLRSNRTQTLDMLAGWRTETIAALRLKKWSAQ